MGADAGDSDTGASAGSDAAALTIRRFEDRLAADFERINRQWIEAMYTLEQTDIDQLTHARERIVDPGGDILFVEHPALGVVGTCALLKVAPGIYELIKMGVMPEARGFGAGDRLLTAAIARAQALGAETLFLLTNTKSATAIRLYERHGFVHDAQIMADYGAEYARCDVAMLWRG